MFRKVIIAVATAALVIWTAGAQEPGKGTSAILLSTDAETLAEAHDIVMNALLANDVDIKADNSEYYITKAAGKPTRSGTEVTCSIACLEMDGRIVIRVSGAYRSPLDNFRTEDKVIKQGARGSIAMQVWNSMYETAMLIPHTAVDYIGSY